jgi:hypothetical protein
MINHFYFNNQFTKFSQDFITQNHKSLSLLTGITHNPYSKGLEFFYSSNKKKENKEKIKEKKSNPKRKIKMKSPFLDLTSLLSLDPSRSISSPY